MNNPDEMTFLQHLEELRWRIIRGLGAILAFAIIAFIFNDHIIAFLTAPALNLENPVLLQALRVSDMFMVQIVASILTGLIFASPVVFYQIWRFVVPAMGRFTRLMTAGVVVAATFFFLMGVTFGYTVMLPLSLRFFTSINAEMVESNFSIQAYLGYVTGLLLAAGLVFQLPIVSLVLTRIGLLTPAFLRHYRRYALVSILIIGAILTPPDPISQILMALPLLLLYELAILIAKLFAPREQT
ncbi:twin-arginine translocase subunit TatC [Candidatus Neomarinimicrobiota bacterium]